MEKDNKLSRAKLRAAIAAMDELRGTNPTMEQVLALVERFHLDAVALAKEEEPYLRRGVIVRVDVHGTARTATDSSGHRHGLGSVGDPLPLSLRAEGCWLYWPEEGRDVVPVYVHGPGSKVRIGSLHSLGAPDGK